jgi:hypothetical protein
MESNRILLKNVLSSLSPKEFYAFLSDVKKKKLFHEKRARSYEKIKKSSGLELWSKETEIKKTEEDKRWLEVYDEIYDNPEFWYELWIVRERAWYFKIKSKFRYANVTPVDYDVLERTEDGSEIKAISADEYFLRLVESIFKTNSVRKIIKNVGKLLLSDERLIRQLEKRRNVEKLDVFVECGLMHRFGSARVARNEENDDDDDDNEEAPDIFVSQIQNVFYMLEFMRRKENRTGFDLLKDPKSVLTDIIPKRFPLRSRLFASSFVDSVMAYCNYRCNVKKDLVFLPKAFVNAEADDVDSERRFVTYDLKRNIAFDNVALFFKYNVYRFKQNSEDPVFDTLCLYDDEYEIFNSCIEFGFENIMEFDVLEQLVCVDLNVVNDRNASEESCVSLKRKVERRRWSRLFEAKDKELRSISVLPCVVKSDRDLLSKDGDRLKDLRLILESRFVGRSRFPKTLAYLLYVSVVELVEFRGGNEENYDFSSPDALRYFFVKKKFLEVLYAKLTDKERTAHNEISSLERLDRFVTETAPFVKYETIEIETEEIAKYLRFIGDDEIDDEYRENLEEEREFDANERRKVKKIRSSDLLLPSKNKTNRRDARTRSVYEREEIDDNVPTDNEDYDDVGLEKDPESDDDDDENNEIATSSAGTNARKRKRTIKITISNVHKDCFLFNESFFLYDKIR